jgi:enoyl-CoA hydratase/carnithine racemase
VEEPLIIEQRDGVQLWRLNRPHRRNAMDFDLLHRVRDAIAGAISSNISVVILTGTGTVFCAGSDLKDLEKLRENQKEGEAPPSPMHELFNEFEQAPFTLVTAIQGSAFGGGCELALLGDVRIAKPEVTFLLPPAKLGILYPSSGMSRLTQILGASLLSAMLTTAQAVSAERLWQQGVIWSLADDLESEAWSLAVQISNLSHISRIGHQNALRNLRR